MIKKFKIDGTHRPIPCAPGSGNVAAILIGPPGSGKETHGKRICEDFHGHHFSVGEHFRARREDPDFTRLYGRDMDNGVALPDPVVVSGIREGFADIPDTGAGALLLDGFLKKRSQVNYLEQVLSHPCDALVLDFVITRKESILRAMRGRPDDHKAGDRFDDWMLHEHRPVLKALRRRGVAVVEIIASDPIEVVYNRVSRVLIAHANSVKFARPQGRSHESTPLRPSYRLHGEGVVN